MDFDDPLADILSDDSNDSFFNDNKYKKKSQTSSVNSKKNDLFGIENESISSKPVNDTKGKSIDDWLGLDKIGISSSISNEDNKVEIKPVPVPAADTRKSSDILNTQKIPKPNVSTNRSNVLDFLDDLDLSNTENSKKPESNPKETLSLDELFGPRGQNNESTKNTPSSEKKSVSFLNYNPTPSNTVKKDLNLELENKPRLKNINKEIPENTRQFGEVKKQEISRFENKENSIITKRQKSSKDWLGILNNSNDDFMESSMDMPESLSNLLSKSVNEEKSLQMKSKNSTNIEKSTIESDASEKLPEKITLDTNSQLGSNLMPELIRNPILSMASDIDIEQQSAAICLQQQESHLMVALQMKAQEEKLAAMHERQVETRRVQQEVVSAHREQLDNILKRQADHRFQLQNIIGEHQHRINKHIELLLKPPEVINTNSASTEKYTDETGLLIKNKSTQIINNESNQLEVIINNIRQNYEREIELMENSYKRQISILNESLINLEDRTKIENEKNHQYFLKQIEKLEQDKIKITDYFENYLQQISDKQKGEIERIEKKHLENMEILQKQHHIVINNIRDTMQLEKETMQGAMDYSKKLNTVISDVHQNSKLCQDVMEKIEKISNANESERIECLKSKEEYLNRMLANLEKKTILYEEESNNTKSLLLAFEQRLNQQKNMINDERQNIKQKEVELSNERDNMKLEYEQLQQKLEHEKEIFKKASAEIENVNAKINHDIETKMNKIEQDSLALKNENKILQESKAEIQIMKLKLQSEMKEINDNKKSLKLEQDQLYQNEMKVLERSKELEVLTRNALAKQKYAESKYSEASFSQQRYEEKFAKIQEQLLSLNAREQQLAKEKVALSRERLLLYNQRSENEYYTCAACRLTNKPQRLIDYNDNSGLKILNDHNGMSAPVIDNISKLKWLENKLHNKDLKEIKDDLNNIDRKNNHNEHGNDITNSFPNNEYNIPAKFQEMVEPKIMALKFDLFETNKYL